MSQKEKRRLRPIANGNYQRKDEYQLCKTLGCRNVIASWAQPQGPKRGYCGFCRRVIKYESRH